jgi:hypothetical protein
LGDIDTLVNSLQLFATEKVSVTPLTFSPYSGAIVLANGSRAESTHKVSQASITLAQPLAGTEALRHM